jgi:putative lipoprotein
MSSTRNPLTLNILPALLCALALLLPACSSPAPNGLVTGALTYNENVALPAGATGTVELVRLGASPTTIATNTIALSGAAPHAFTLTYDPTRIDVTQQHALRARIAAPGGQMMFMTQSDVAYDFDGSPVTLLLTSVGAGGSGTVGTQRR